MEQGEEEKGQKDSAQWNPLLFKQKVVIINKYINYHLTNSWYSCDINRAESNATSIRNINELNLVLHVTTRKYPALLSPPKLSILERGSIWMRNQSVSLLTVLISFDASFNWLESH